MKIMKEKKEAVMKTNIKRSKLRLKQPRIMIKMRTNKLLNQQTNDLAFDMTLKTSNNDTYFLGCE